MLTGEQIRGARAMLRWEQKDLAQASGVSEQTVIRLEKMTGQVTGQISTIQSIKDAFETAGIKFIPENGGGPGVRLRKL